MSIENPTLTLTVSNVSKLEHIQKWAEIAEAVGLSGSSEVRVSASGAISVSRFNAHVPWPVAEGNE